MALAVLASRILVLLVLCAFVAGLGVMTAELYAFQHRAPVWRVVAR
jgi:NADH:ubiquinone oxidoreductase subunit D